ncbi:MAG: sialidase family protein [Planctomycetota bacterium]
MRTIPQHQPRPASHAAPRTPLTRLTCLLSLWALSTAARGQALVFDAGAAGAPVSPPTAQGWTLDDPSSGQVQVGPLAPDPGTLDNAWRIVDASAGANTRAHYAALLAPGLAAGAAARGWQLQVRLRVLSGSGVDAFFEFASGRGAADDRYLVFLSVAGQDLVVHDWNAGVAYTVPGAVDGQHHDLTLVKAPDPGAQEATLSFDGAPLGVVRRAPSTASAPAGGVHFGAGSSGGTVTAHFRSVAFQLGPPVDLDFVDVFVPGQGYPSFRIPALLATERGALLAFAEGRQSLNDHAQNDIVLRRSVDGGATWLPLQVMADEGADALNNPCAVEVREGPHRGRILLHYQRYPAGCHESCVVPGWTGPNICRGYVMHSDDDGATWTAPREITSEVKAPTVMTSIAGGPGVGLQKRRAPHAGRIIVPYNHGEAGSVWRVYAVWSDDGGDTWSHGQDADDTQSPGFGNEVQMVELADGALLLNARGQGGVQRRKVARSLDGGATWTPLLDSALVEPQCMASIVRYSDPLDGAPSRIVYAGPDSTTARVRGTLRVSYDEGATWPVARLIYAGGFAYSVAVRLPDARLGVLFERDGYARITLARTSLEWVTSGDDCAAGGAIIECPPAPNSAGPGSGGPNSGGPGATLRAVGSLSLARASLALASSGLPSSTLALVLYGRVAAVVPAGDGTLCIGAPGPYRLAVVQADPLGLAGWTPTWTQAPLGAGPDALAPGQAARFQLWYRDAGVPGGSGFNFSESLSITFCP